MVERLRQRQEWHLVRALWRADRPLAGLWWLMVVLRGLLPAAFAVATGVLVGAVNADDPLGGPLVFMGVVFVLIQLKDSFSNPNRLREAFDVPVLGSVSMVPSPKRRRWKRAPCGSATGSSRHGWRGLRARWPNAVPPPASWSGFAWSGRPNWSWRCSPS